jgi:predicted histidine transporter YuiF (NhaC family)
VEAACKTRCALVIWVDSNNSKLSNQIFAELVEQVERTFSNNFVYKYLKNNMDFIPALLAIIGVLITVLLSFYQTGNSKKENLSNQKFTNKEVAELLAKSQQASNTNDKIDFLFEVQNKELARLEKLQNSDFRISDFFYFAELVH